MSINSLFYTSLCCKLASVVALLVFFYAYWANLDDRTMLLALSLSFTSYLVGRAFHFYFEQVVARIAVAKHIAEKNILEQIEAESTDEDTNIFAHPLFEEKEEEDND